MPRQRTPQAEPTALLTIPETALRLGCSDMHVYRLISSGELSAVDVSQRGSRRPKTRVRSDDLASYIDARTRRISESTGPAA